MIEEISALIGNLFIDQIFGDLVLTGLFVLVFVIALGVALRLSFDAMVVVIVPVLILISGYGLLGEYGGIVQPIVLLVIGIIIALAILKMIRRY